MFLFATTPQSLPCLLSTEDPTEKFFVLQVGDKSDSVSVDRLKLVITAVLVTPAVTPVPASVTRPPDPGRLLVKKVRFSVPVPAKSLAGTLIRRFEVHRLSQLSSSLNFWGNNLWLQRRPSFIHGLQ